MPESKTKHWNEMDDQSRDEWLAEHKFGWKWMSWIGIPIRGTPGYPKECRVRQFMSPEWVSQMPDKPESYPESREATGDEPLSYSYCSANFPQIVPAYSSNPPSDFEPLKLALKAWREEMKAAWLTLNGEDEG